MKKLLLSLLLFAVGLGGVKAQRGNAFNDGTLFMSLGAGGVYYQSQEASKFNVPTAGLSFGRWLMRPLAFRIAGDLAIAPSRYQMNTSATSTFFYGSAEFMWDVNATFFHVYNKNFLYPFPFYPLIGLGVAYRPAVEGIGADHDFQSMLGLHFPVRLSKRFDAFLEYKCFILPETFDGDSRESLMHTFKAGLTYRWSDNPFARTTAFESRSTRDDWFVGFGAGVSFSSFEFEYFNNPKARLWNPTPEIMFGRNYSSVWTIRFELSGFFARERAKAEIQAAADGSGLYGQLKVGKWYVFNMLHTDFMVNLSHLLNFNRGTRWNFFTYMGAGPVWRYRSKTQLNVGADFGIMARRFMDNMGDFYIDLKYLMVPPRIAGNTGDISILGVGYPTLTFGYIFNFEHSTTRYRMPVNSTIN